MVRPRARDRDDPRLRRGREAGMGGGRTRRARGGPTRRGAHAIRNSVLEADAAGRRLLEWLGYVAVRVFREMRIELDAPPHAPAWPDGLRAAPFDPDSNAAHTRSTLSATAEFAMNLLAQSVNTRDGLAGMKLGRSPRSHRTPPRRVRDPSRGHKRSRGCPNGCRRRRFSRGSVRFPDVRALGGNTPESPWPSRTRHCGGDGGPRNRTWRCGFGARSRLGLRAC